MSLRRRLVATASALALSVGLAGTAALTNSAQAATTESPAEISAKIDALLPAPTPEGQSDVDAVANTQWTDISNAAIDPSQYQCSSTDLLNWLSSKSGSPELMSALSRYSLFDLPEYQALIFEDSSKTTQRIGENGEYTDLITNEMRDLKSFWDIDGQSIQLIGMHTDIYKDPAKLAPLVEVLYGVDADTAKQVAPLFIQLVDMMPDGADNPYFTFNAFAYGAKNIDPSSILYGVPRKIIVGDGIIDGFNALGMDMSTTLRSIVGHEYGHQVQYADDLEKTTLTGPEASRRLELMADAFGSYFMVHARGQAVNAKRVHTVELEAFNVGDCGYTSADHHGTPNQRIRSVDWAADLANSARPQGPVMPSREFDSKFEDELPQIVAPDA